MCWNKNFNIIIYTVGNKMNYPGLQAGGSDNQIQTGLQPETNALNLYLLMNS